MLLDADFACCLLACGTMRRWDCRVCGSRDACKACADARGARDVYAGRDPRAGPVLPAHAVRMAAICVLRPTPFRRPTS